MFADVIIDEEGTWVSIDDRTHWPHVYYKIEDIRAKDFDRSRGARYSSGTRTGRFGVRDPYQFPRRSSGDDEGFHFVRDGDPLAEGLAYHDYLMRKYGPA